MNAPVTHIIPITTFRRERLLPFPGKILVRKGQRVNATDIVAEANLRCEHILIDVVRALGVSLRQIDRYIRVEENLFLEKGDLLAGPAGFPSRRVYSPCAGQVIFVDGGQILIEATGRPVQLKAGTPGEVVELIPDKGVVIEATGALIQGVWGNGKIEFGLMTVLAKKPDHVLTADQIDVSLRGGIILAGHCTDAASLQAAEDLPLRGLILSSLPVSLLAQAKKLSIPVLLTEGFGQRWMNSVAHKLLSTNDRHEIALNADTWNNSSGARPEIVIPLPGSGNLVPPQDSAVFSPNRQVRVLRAPYAGKIATLTRLKGAYVFPGGLRALAAEVRLESGDFAVIPLANLEIIA